MKLKMTPERAMAAAVVYLTFMALAFAIFWYILLVGGNPLTVRSIVAVDASGSVATKFHRGDLVGVRRVLCSTRDVDAQLRMAIRSDLGLMVPLFGVSVRVKEGCHQYGYGFIMPPLPVGTYAFSSTAIFQTNLVGRDEFAEFEPVTIEVLP